MSIHLVLSDVATQLERLFDIPACSPTSAWMPMFQLTSSPNPYVALLATSIEQLSNNDDASLMPTCWRN